MPANRSRTERWRDCLQQIQERGGGIEFTISRPGLDPETVQGDLLWRVRIIRQSERELVVEAPSAMGQPIHLNEGVDVVGVLAVGQNRWMFHSRTLGMVTTPGPRGLGMPAVRLQMPEEVERCQRRGFLRVSTAELRLPEVECFPLLDPTSAIAAEEACRAQIKSGRAPESGAVTELPNVGPVFRARLLNIGGGGLGLLVGKSDSAAIHRSKFLWTRLDLRPEIPAPLAVSARVAHTHLTHEQDVYAGIAFDFAFHPAHRPFVSDTLVRYVESLQERQHARRDAA